MEKIGKLVKLCKKMVEKIVQKLSKVVKKLLKSQKIGKKGVIFFKRSEEEEDRE
jgi:hypothetical protein